MKSVIKIKDFGKHQAALGQRFKKVVREAMQATGKEAVAFLQSRSRKKNIMDRGKFIDGWRAKQKAFDEVRVYNAAKHAIFVEKGRGRNKRMPPHRPIANWLRRRGVAVPSGKRGQALTYPVRRAIGKKGIRARPILTSRINQLILRRKFRSNVQKALRKSVKEAYS